ncbi:hypothetical protein NPIL_547901 [Nephila pilipes]|uniref:Uncharacterized protein n=1 Tax=Nephila pilipes TaxID=299642 RepID=A0A8X6U839_NEPPI|nr:hypothetical protein NPIL_547901 [Nephila pilipes]
MIFPSQTFAFRPHQCSLNVDESRGLLLGMCGMRPRSDRDWGEGRESINLKSLQGVANESCKNARIDRLLNWNGWNPVPGLDDLTRGDVARLDTDGGESAPH